MAPQQITERDALEAALASGSFLLFKHSPVCPVSAKAKSEYEAFVAEREVPTGWIDVIAQRDWSQWVAHETRVEHQSPQALLVRGGKVAWHASHFGITQAALREALAS